MAVQLMDLPEELLLNILKHVQPEPPQPWGPTGEYYSYKASKAYRCFQMSTLISRKYRRVAVAVFNASYIHAVYMTYHMRRRNACTVEKPRLQREHRQVKRLHLRVDAYDFEDASTFSLDITDYLGRFTALRELVITVEVFETQPTVAESEAKIRGAIVDWAQGPRRCARLIVYNPSMAPGWIEWQSHYSHGNASWQAESARIERTWRGLPPPGPVAVPGAELPA
ncbi:hypothetical protein LTR17_023767 [Elasticomyces elasticus]|nr:hypothetical protein LTR17_023767 [Elasticomyces elasticus]